MDRPLPTAVGAAHSRPATASSPVAGHGRSLRASAPGGPDNAPVRRDTVPSANSADAGPPLGLRTPIALRPLSPRR